MSIGTPPEGLQKMDLEEPTIVIEDSPDLPPLWEVFGAARRDDGRVGVRMTLHDEGNGDRPITSGSAVFRIVG